MSYILVDETGNKADLASNHGMVELHDNAGPLLKSFLESGGIMPSDIPDLIDELSDTPFAYIAGALATMEGKVVISNGVVEDDEGAEP